MIKVSRWAGFLAATAIVFSTVTLPAPESQAKAARVRPEVTIDAVTGEGTSSNAAKLDAFRNAVSQAVGVYVSSDTVVENYVTKSDKIRTHSEGFIKSSQMLKESKADGVVTAVYKVVVSTEPIKQDLKSVVGAEFSAVGHPSVAVVGWYQGRTREETEVNAQAVAAMNRSLIQRGYKVVDGYLIEKLRKEDQEIVKASQQVQKSNFDKVALKIANKLKADLYVTTFGSIESGKASVATRLYNSYTAQILGEDTGYASANNRSLASAKAAVELAVQSSMERLLPEVSKHWQNVINNGQEFIVVLEGYKGGKERRKFKSILKDTDGVMEVKELNAAGNHAEYSIYANASPGDLFDEIIGMAEDEGMKFFNDEAVVRGGRAVFILKN